MEEFRSYLADDPEDLNAEGIVHICVGLPADEGTENYVVRTPLELDREKGHMYFPGGGLQSGTPFRMLRRDPDGIRQGVLAAAADLKQRVGARPALAVLQFDCAGRGMILFGRNSTDEIVAPLAETFGEDVPIFGFHTYGEIAPVEGHIGYHNYTAVYAALIART